MNQLPTDFPGSPPVMALQRKLHGGEDQQNQVKPTELTEGYLVIWPKVRRRTKGRLRS
jgi:hypothetical protein